MPFAPVTPEDFASACYVDWKPEHIASHFMTRTYKCHDSFVKKHPAVVHVDGTARPQIIKKEHNPEENNLRINIHGAAFTHEQREFGKQFGWRQ